MSHKSSFFNAVESGGVYDRTYTAEDFAEYFAQFVGNGVFPDPTTGLRVRSSGGMQILIDPGYAWINGYLFAVVSGTTDSLTVPVADSTLNRIDSVIVGLDLVNRQVTPYIRSGSPSSSPDPVSLVRSGSIYEIELAQILVTAGTYQITQANITDKRQDSSRCGLVAGLIDQINTTDLFEQFTARFNTWFSDLQDTLDEDVAANLLLRIQGLEQNRCKYYKGFYTGSGLSGPENENSVALPFVPSRVDIVGTYSVGAVHTVCNLSLYRSSNSQVLSLFGKSVIQTYNLTTEESSLKVVPIFARYQNYNGGILLTWYTGSNPEEQLNLHGIEYSVDAWGV